MVILIKLEILLLFRKRIIHLEFEKKCKEALNKYPNSDVLSLMLNSIIRRWVLYYGVELLLILKKNLN